MKKKLLQINNLRIQFQTHSRKTIPVQDISFYVDAGTTVGIVGESGSGKTVTAHAILQLLPQDTAQIIRGNILFNGEDLVLKSPHAMEAIRGSQISMIFQDPMTSLNPTMRIGQQISESVRKHQKVSKAEAQSKALEMLQLVGITPPEEWVNAFPYQLSGGMRQRVMIAIALACEPLLLIADEPTTALDVTTQAQILSLLNEIQKKRQMSIILITHDLGIVAGLCDRIVIMYAGMVVEEGDVNSIFYNPQHPYTEALLKAVPRFGTPKNVALTPIEGNPPNCTYLTDLCPFLERCPHAMRICGMSRPPYYIMDKEQRAACWRHHIVGEQA